MKDELITYDTALLAKEKGFDEWALQDAYYDPGSTEPGTLQYAYHKQQSFSTPNRWHRLIQAPTQSLLQRWLREVHKIYVCMEPHSVGPGVHSWWLSKPQHFYKFSNVHELEHPYEFWSYEEALEKGLQAALKLIPDTKSTT